MTLYEALTDGAFDRLNEQHSEEFDQNFSKKSNAPGFALGGWAVWNCPVHKGKLIATQQHIVNNTQKTTIREYGKRIMSTKVIYFKPNSKFNILHVSFTSCYPPSSLWREEAARIS